MNWTKTKDETDYSVLEENYEIVKKYKNVMLSALSGLMEVISMLPECKGEYPERLNDFAKFDPCYTFMAEVVWAMNEYGIEVVLPEEWREHIPLGD